MSLTAKVRRIVRRSAKPLVMATIAGGVAMSLVVTTPSNAQAFVAPVLPAIYGATTMAIPELMATSAILGPVGWGIAGATVLGVGLYATKDYWLPYVTGLFGQGTQDTQPDSGTRTATFVPGLKITGGRVSAATSYGQRYDYDLYYSGGSTINKSYVVASWVSCRGTDGVVRTAGGPQSSSSVNTTNRAKTGGTYCPNVGDTLVGVVLGARNAAPEFPTESTIAGPENVWRYGDTIKDSFDPKSPQLKYRVEAECIDQYGTKSTAEALSTGDKAGITFPSCEAAGKGHGTGKVTVWATPPGTQTEQNIWSATAPTASPDKPLCSPQRAGSGCKLAVKLDTKDCVMGVFECENWAELSKDPNFAPRYSCQYGPYVVPLETCNPLERGYEPGGAPATEPNLDGDPSTRADAQPDGSTQPKPQTDPNAPPATGTAPGGFPTNGTNNEEDPCLKDAWSWTPADWVKNPVVCAMKDAFVPKQDIQARSNTLRDQARLKVPFAWSDGAILGPSGGGCPNWTINVAGLHENVICGSSFTQALLGVRGPLFGLVASAMVWPLLRGIWYASIPVLRVSPGSSK